MCSNSRKLEKTMKIVYISVITVLVSDKFNKICSLVNSLNISFWEHVMKPSLKKVISTCSFGPQHQLEKRRFFETSSFSNPRFFCLEVFQGTCQRCVNVRKKVLSTFEKLHHLAFTNLQISGPDANASLSKCYRGSLWTLNGL